MAASFTAFAPGLSTVKTSLLPLRSVGAPFFFLPTVSGCGCMVVTPAHSPVHKHAQTAGELHGELQAERRASGKTATEADDTFGRARRQPIRTRLVWTRAKCEWSPDCRNTLTVFMNPPSSCATSLPPSPPKQRGDLLLLFLPPSYHAFSVSARALRRAHVTVALIFGLQGETTQECRAASRMAEKNSIWQGC